MPKGGDPHCPLGFHPQFRRPNYCKRCFRDYSEHKAKDLSGSTTSINSLTSYDPNTNSFTTIKRNDSDSTSLYGSRDSLVSSARTKDEVEGKPTLTRSYSEDKDADKGWSITSKTEPTFGNKVRPMSWSAQDLRSAVSEVKETSSASKEDIYSSFSGSTKSLDKDAGYESKSSSNTSTDKKDQDPAGKNYSSFSSYLNMRTKSPARPPGTTSAIKSSTTVQGTSSTSSLNNKDSKRNGSLHSMDEDVEEVTVKVPSRFSSSSNSSNSNSSSDNKPLRSSLSTIGESRTSSSSSSSEARPPRAPVRIKERSLSAKLPDLKESSSESKPKTILSLKEVKSVDDDSADASYVIKLSKPKTKKVEIDLNSEVERLQKENKEMAKELKDINDKHTQLELEYKEISAKKPRFGDVRKHTEISKLQQKIDDLSDDNKSKNKEVKELKKEIDKRPLPKDVDKTITDLRSKLQAAEQLCEELMDENEDYKKDVQTMEDEIEEMQDNFREDQADEYRDLKRELEQRAKDCRVMQFKLKKAERRADAMERGKSESDDKLRDLQLGDHDLDRVERIKALERELGLAKEVSLKMHQEMEKIKKDLENAEVDKKKLKEKVADSPSKVSSGRYSRSSMMGRQGSQDNSDQLLRDLQDTQEREQDLKEQLRFAEEEGKGMRKKLSRVEEENETLQLQLNKMSSKAKVNRQRSLERSNSLERQSSVERGSLSRQGSTEKPAARGNTNADDMDPTEMKIQLELNEQETVVLRRKLESSESENERLQKEFKEMLSYKDSKKSNSLGKAPEASKDNMFFDKKIKMLEEELTEIRKKLIDSETERDQLKSDLDLTRKRSKMNRSRSSEQADSELKKRLEIIEKDCDGLRTKNDELATENDTLTDETKRLQLKAMKRLPMTSQENMYVENQVLQDKIKRLEKRTKDMTLKLKNAESSNSASGNGSDRDAEISELKNKIHELEGSTSDMNSLVAAARAPKVPKDTTPKTTLVKWVNELEAECTRLQLALKELEKRKSSTRSTINGKEDVSGLQDIRDQMSKEREKVDELTHQLKEEREKSDKSQSMEKRLSQRADDLRRYEDKILSLKKELDDERDKNSELRSQVKEGSLVGFEELRAAQSDKHRTQKELEEEKTLLTASEERHKEMTVSWLKEREDLKNEISTLRRTKDKAEEEVKRAQKNLDSAESKLTKEQKKAKDIQDSQKKDGDEVRKLKIANENLLSDLDDSKDTIHRLEREKDRISSKISKEAEDLRGEKEDLRVRMTTLESELKSERLKRERLEKEKESNNKSSSKTQAGELADVQRKLTKAEQDVKRLSSELEAAKTTYDEKLQDLQTGKKKEHKQLMDLQVKFDLLEEDFVVQKAQNTTKSNTSGNYASLKREYDTIDTELKKLRETYNVRQDTWIKEKLAMQEQVKDLEMRQGRAAGDSGSFIEKNRLKDILEDKNIQIEKLKRDDEILRDQLSHSRREGEHLRRKVDDLEKLSDLQDRRQTTSTGKDTSGYETTIKELRTRLTQSEKTMKTETTKIKLKYDSKLKALAEEVSTLSSHMSKYRRERDTYKGMLDAAQKNITELKSGNGGGTSYRTSRADNASELANYQSQMIDLQTLTTELEDKLADYRLENTKLKNDLVDVKTNADIQLVEAQTKLNEYEEDRLLGGGSRKVPGLRTRLELNWQKEREEQQRLLQETATLAKDLRQTLYEVERERDLEKLEAKRKIEQLKRSVNVDQQDTIGKVQELQRDLQELREAHAKLRQINEKLRREKDRTEVEREAMRDKYLGGSRESLNQQAKVERISEEMRKIRDLAPLMIGESIDGRDSSLTSLVGDAKPKTREEFSDALKKLVRGMDDLKGMMGIYDDRDRLRRATSLRRALSIESDDEGSTTGSLRSRSVGRGGLHRLHHLPKQQKSNLYRKAQSLDHQMAEDRGKIWVSTDAGSTSSIESSMTEEMRRAKYERDVSMDRISTGSQTSEREGEKKPKTGIKKIFSKLSKARSIEDSATGGSIVDVGVKAMGVGSGKDIPSDVEKDSVKSKIKTLFKGKNPPSRSQSTERDATSGGGGNKVKKAKSLYETDTASVASNTSISSTSNIPPVLRRLQGRSSAFGPTIGSGRTGSLSNIGRQSSQETQV